MSDVSQGPGWWQASDGRWYPPEQVPGVPTPPPRPNVPPGRAHDSPGRLWKTWQLALASLVALVLGVGIGVATATDNDADGGTVAAGADEDEDEGTTTTEADAEEEDEDDATTTTDASTTTEPPVAALPANANPAVAVEGGVEFGAGTPGQLSVVAQAAGLDRSGSLPVVVRNMTNGPKANVAVTGTARDAGGALVASGESQGFQPFLVGPGEIAFGYVFFSSAGIPDGSTLEFGISGADPDELFAGSIDLTVAEYNRTEDAVIGVLRNDSGVEATGPIGVDMICFDAAGTPTEQRSTFAVPDVAPPGATVSFSFDFFGDPPCDRFLLGGNGFDF